MKMRSRIVFTTQQTILRNFHNFQFILVVVVVYITIIIINFCGITKFEMLFSFHCFHFYQAALFGHVTSYLKWLIVTIGVLCRICCRISLVLCQV